MLEKIDKPKVFISYAWGTKEYQDKVLSFAFDLVRDGIDVELDRWSLKEGNDTYAFMEQSVTSSDITNVLILLNPEYERKANGRSGGVGTETQIISPEIYNKIKQEKFLPVVFERKSDGGIPKPTYLKGLLHFDLSCEENYDEEYQRLIKRLYGVEVIKKPELGSRPSWLDDVNIVATKTRNKFEVLKGNMQSNIKQQRFDDFMSEICTKIVEFRSGENKDYSDMEYIGLFDEIKVLRDEFLLLMKYVMYVDKGEKIVASQLEGLCDELDNKNDMVNDIRRTLLHELFIYVISIYYKTKKYDSLSYILNKTYFMSRNSKANSYHIFYGT